MDKPECPNCKKSCSPCGGTLNGNGKQTEWCWVCWDCGYRIDDNEYSIIEQQQIEDKNN